MDLSKSKLSHISLKRVGNSVAHQCRASDQGAVGDGHPGRPFGCGSAVVDSHSMEKSAGDGAQNCSKHGKSFLSPDGLKRLPKRKGGSLRARSRGEQGHSGAVQGPSRRFGPVNFRARRQTSSLVGFGGQVKSRQNFHHVKRSPLVVLGEDTELDRLTTTLFQLFFGLWMLSCPFLLANAFSNGSAHMVCSIFAAAGLLLAALCCLKPLLRCQLVLDTERQELYLRYRRFFFFTSLMPVGGAEELAGTTWAGELPQAPFTFWWRYVSLIITQKGRRFRALRSDRNSRPAEDDARRLAYELGTRCYPGRQQSLLRLSRQGGELRFRHQPLAASQWDGCALIYWGVFILPSLFLLANGAYQLWQWLPGP